MAEITLPWRVYEKIGGIEVVPGGEPISDHMEAQYAKWKRRVSNASIAEGPYHSSNGRSVNSKPGANPRKR